MALMARSAKKNWKHLNKSLTEQSTEIFFKKFNFIYPSRLRSFNFQNNGCECPGGKLNDRSFVCINISRDNSMTNVTTQLHTKRNLE